VLEAEGLREAWAGATVLRPAHGGHSALLRDPAVVSAIGSFVSG
jgi:hypothetical protein